MGRARKVKQIISLTIEGMDGLLAEQNEARIEAEVNDMRLEWQKPLADVSQQAGKMERESPLFFGTGANPTLF